MSDTFDTILDVLKRCARAEILKDFRPDSCIASTRIVIRVLGHFGFDAVPFPCVVYIFNKVFVDAVEGGHPIPQGPEELRAFLTRFKGAWSIGLGAREPTVDTVGHIAVIARGHSLLIDASLNQCDRPEYDIALPPVLALPVDANFVDYGEPANFEVNNCLLRIQPELPWDQRWKASPNWIDPQQTRRATRVLIRCITEEL